MKILRLSFIIVAIFAVMTCQQGNKEVKKEVEKTTVVKEGGKTSTTNEVSKEPGQAKPEPTRRSGLPYELKEPGLYVYADGPDVKLWHNSRCFEYIQKNYKYIPVPLQDEMNDTREIWDYCCVQKTCITDLGKPSLKELGYDRHKEREIKPEDNRFGVNVTKEIKWWDKELTKIAEYSYKYVDADKFIKMTPYEFINNGIIIIGKNISRVLIKKPLAAPFAINKRRILVEYTYDYFGCNSKPWSETVSAPIIANFRRIDLKENIFEFIQEEPLPDNASYLTDEQFIKLSEDVYQLIPRQIDKTLNPVTFNAYYPGYYLIEYYEGNKLVAWYGILLNGKGEKPPLWPGLVIKYPN
jgi:hypothetical protein